MTQPTVLDDMDAARPEGFRRVAQVLQERGHPHAPLWLDVAARTCAEAAQALQVQVGQIAKSVIFRGVRTMRRYWFASGDRRVDEHRVAAQVGPICHSVISDRWHLLFGAKRYAI